MNAVYSRMKADLRKDFFPPSCQQVKGTVQHLEKRTKEYLFAPAEPGAKRYSFVRHFNPGDVTGSGLDQTWTFSRTKTCKDQGGTAELQGGQRCDGIKTTAQSR